RCKRIEAERSPNIHKVPNPGVRKRIPHKPLFDAAEEDRNGARVMSDRKTNQNMVSKQADEAQEGDSGDQRIKRTRKTSASTESGGGGCRSAGRSKLVDDVDVDGRAAQPNQLR
ncbi:hypothetical protein HHI36_017364, partial [Cryptolaemus montrouzieri]